MGQKRPITLAPLTGNLPPPVPSSRPPTTEPVTQIALNTTKVLHERTARCSVRENKRGTSDAGVAGSHPFGGDQPNGRSSAPTAQVLKYWLFAPYAIASATLAPST